jgi:steroid 5-alpha reductase family enzyme
MFVCTALMSGVLLPWVDSPVRLRTLQVLRPMLIGTVLMAVQALSMSYSLGRFGDATRINIVYALRGLWAVLLAWILARVFGGAESQHSRSVMLLRLFGAILLTLSVLVALSDSL